MGSAYQALLSIPQRGIQDPHVAWDSAGRSAGQSKEAHLAQDHAVQPSSAHRRPTRRSRNRSFSPAIPRGQSPPGASTNPCEEWLPRGQSLSQARQRKHMDCARADKAIVLVAGTLAVGMLLSSAYLRSTGDLATSTTVAGGHGLWSRRNAAAIRSLPTSLPRADAPPSEAHNGPAGDEGASSFEAALDEKAGLGGGLSCHGRRHYDIGGDAAFVC